MAKDRNRTGSATVLKSSVLPAAQDQLAAWLQGAGVDPQQDTAIGIGGAWVDAHMGRPARDYDINLYVAPDRREQVLQQLAATAETHMYAAREAVVFHLPGQVIADVKIVGKPQSPQQALRDIDVGISAVAADMFSGKVWAATEFHQDLAKQVVRLRPGHKPTPTNTAYMKKLSAKYPGFSNSNK